MRGEGAEKQPDVVAFEYGRKIVHILDDVAECQGAKHAAQIRTQLPGRLPGQFGDPDLQHDLLNAGDAKQIDKLWTPTASRRSPLAVVVDKTRLGGCQTGSAVCRPVGRAGSALASGAKLPAQRGKDVSRLLGVSCLPSHNQLVANRGQDNLTVRKQLC